MLAERSAKLEQTERDLDDNRRALHALNGEQLPGDPNPILLRTCFVKSNSAQR